MKLTKQEMNLINVVRNLCFEDVLDAVEGIQIKQGDADTMVLRKLNEGETKNAEGFRERAVNLDKLQDALGRANADFCAHIHSEEIDKKPSVVAKRMRDIIGEIRMDGEVISFKEFLEGMGGSGEIYDPWYSEILEAALNPNTDWAEVDDIIGPLAHEILSEAIEVSMNIYLELLTAIKLAHEKLMIIHKKEQEVEKEDKVYVINEKTVDVFTVIEDMLHRFNGGWLIKEFKAVDAGDCHLVLKHPESTEIS